MDYCGPIGLPHSQFLDWDPNDQDKAIAWVLHKGAVCSHCGTYPDLWMDDNGEWIEPAPYNLKNMKCGGCELLEEGRSQAKDSSAVHWYFERSVDG